MTWAARLALEPIVSVHLNVPTAELLLKIRREIPCSTGRLAIQGFRVVRSPLIHPIEHELRISADIRNVHLVHPLPGRPVDVQSIVFRRRTQNLYQ